MEIQDTIAHELIVFVESLNISRENIQIDVSDQCIELIAPVDPTDQNSIIRIVIFFLHDSKQIQIPNIIVPRQLKYSGNGKHMIRIIYEIGKQHRYDVFIVDMVESFYQKMIARGAIPVDADSVQIIDTTNLEGKNDITWADWDKKQFWN